MMRRVAVFAIAPIAALVTFAFLSCDSGGEPAAHADAAESQDVILAPTGDAMSVEADLPETSNPDAGESDATEPEEEASIDAGPCGNSGESCCAGSECNVGMACNSLTKACSPCGGPGDPCCALNTCGDGGCCVGNVCASPTSVCFGTDAAVCANSACGACGGSGQPCCMTTESFCTAPQSLCPSATAGGVCVACGGPGDPCCVGSSCAGGLVCDGVKCH